MTPTYIIPTLLAMSLVAGCAQPGDRQADDRMSDSARSASAATTTQTPASPTSTQRDSMANTAGARTTPPAQMGRDGVVLATLAAVNAHEIAASNEVAGKQSSAPVKRYAAMMVAEHTANQAKARALGQPREDAEVQALKAKKAGERTAITRLQGRDFERGYVDAMIRDHTEVLAMIDAKLLPMADSEGVRRHLNETRIAVARHLEEARALRAGL